MSKGMRRTIIVAGVLVLLLVGAAVILPSFIDVNRYHDQIETRIAATLGREVHLGEMQLRILPRVLIDVRDLSIAALPSEGGGDLLTAARLRLGVRLLPLLGKSVQITSVRLEKPVLVLDRDASGAFNIERLIATGPTEEAAARSDAAPDAGAAFAVDVVHISGGTLTLRDAALSPGRTLTVTLEDIDARLTDLAPDRPVEVNLTTGLAGQPDARITIRGRVGPLQPGVGKPFTADLRVEISGLSLQPLGDWSEALAGFILPRGTLALTAAARFTGADEGDLSIESLDVRLDRSHLDLAGTLRLSGHAVEVNLEARRVEIDPGEVKAILDDMGVAWPLPPDFLGNAPMTAAGTARLELVLDPTGPRLLSLAADNVELSGGEVNLRRHADGTWNVTSAAAEDSPADEGGTPARLALSGLHLKNILVIVRDDQTPAARPLTIRNLDVTLDGLPTSAPARFTLKAAVDTGAGKPTPISANGTVGPVGDSSEVAVNLTVQINDFPIAFIEPYAAPYLAIEATSGTFDLNATVQGTLPAAFETAGNLAFNQLVVTVPKPTRERQPDRLDLGIAFDIGVADDATRVTFRDLTMTIDGDALGLSGHLDRSGATTKIDATLRPSTIAADRIAALLATFDHDPGFSFSSRRPVRLEGHLSGPLGGAIAPKVTARVVLDEFTFRHPVMTAPMEDVRATIEVDGEQISIEGFSGVIGGSDLSGSMTLAGFATPDIQFDLHARHADFWELMSFVSTDAEVSAGPGALGTGGGDAAAVLDTVTARGTLTIDEGSFQALAFSGLSAGLGLRGQVITLDPLEMDLYDGHFTGSIRLDQTVTPPTFRVVTTATEIDIAPLLSGSLDAGDMLSGRFSGQVTVQGAGTNYEAIIPQMTGEGKIELRDGHIGQLDLLAILSKASGIFGEQTLQKLSRKFEAEGTAFSRMTGSFELAGGTLRSDDLRVDSPDVNMRGKTSIHLIDGTLDGTFNVLLSPELSESMRQEKSRAAEMFWDSRERRVNVPLTLAGPFASPAPNIDWSMATRNMARTRGREALKSRLGSFGALLDRGENPSPTPQATSPTSSGSGAAAMSSSTAADSGSGTGGRLASPAGVVQPDAPAPMDVQITRIRWSGNFLFKNLVVEGTVAGADVDHLSAWVTDGSGRTIQTFARIDLPAAVTAPPAGGAVTPRAWRFKVDGKKLLGVDDPFTVHVVAHGSGGTTTEMAAQVRR